MATSTIMPPELALPAFSPVTCRTRTFDFSSVYVVGIVNITPDSFSDGGTLPNAEAAVARALELVAEGADVIDIGGESTRPAGSAYGKGASTVDTDEEMQRVLPVIEALAAQTDVPISIDTTKAAVARAALDVGAQIVNDISGLRMDRGMATVLGKAGCPAILMHMRGTPATTNSHANYRNLLSEVFNELTWSIDRATRAGLPATQIILDPGLGFGKNLEHNLTLIRRLAFLRCLSGRPVLVGPSRKRFIGELLEGAAVDGRDWGTAGAIAASVMAGADFVRVHNVAAMRDVVRVAAAIRREAPSYTPEADGEA